MAMRPEMERMMVAPALPKNNPNARPSFIEVRDDFDIWTPFKRGSDFGIEAPKPPDPDSWRELYESSLTEQTKRWPSVQRHHVEKHSAEILVKAWTRLDEGTESPEGYVPKTIHQAITHELAQYTACIG